ncbi:MAG: porin [Pirellulales bacterium]
MNTYNVFAYDAGGADLASRVTWTPWYDEESEGRCMLHLGFSATERRCTNGQDRLRVRGTVRNGLSQAWSNFADTTIFYSSGSTLLVPEVALLMGSWQFQAEYFGQWNRDVAVQGAGGVPNPGPNLGTAYFQGYYAQVGYFLTGEHRHYERKNGAFGRIIPHENFHWLKSGRGYNLLTSGAWQVLYRYQMLDLDDPRLANVNAVSAGAVNGVGGGTVYDHTLGLNHFLNPNMKVQYNVVIGERGPSAATPAIAGQTQTGGMFYGFGWRFAFDF